MELVNENTRLDFMWLKERGVRQNNGAQDYESFKYYGVKYKLYDCVYMCNGGRGEPYIGKLTKIWECPDKKKKVEVHWFFHPKQIPRWLGETKTLENEILIATGKGLGLANINPLEAIDGLCKVVCISKDNRNPQPSDEQLKAADFVFYRTVNVQTSAISDNIGDKVGGLEIKYVFNREKTEKVSPFHESISDTKEMSTKKSMVDSKSKHEDKSPADVNNLIASGTSDTTEDLKKCKISAKETSEDLEGQILKKKGDQNLKTTVDSKSKHEDKSTADVNNLNASGTFGTMVDRKKRKILEKETSDYREGNKIKKTRDGGSFKVPDSKMGNNVNVRDSVAISKGKSTSGIASDIIRNNKNNTYNKEGKEGQSGENNRELSMTKLLKVSTLSTNKVNKNAYRYHEFVVSPKPKAEKHCWFTRAHWEDRLKSAYNQGTAILLHNVNPDYNSGDIEDIIWHAFKVNCDAEIHCDAKILQRSSVSSPHHAQALIVLKTKEDGQRVLTKLDEECLMLSDGKNSFMPLVGTPCPAISTGKNSSFYGNLAGKARFRNQREDEAVSTSHFSQPNTIEYDMAMEWRLLQLQSVKCWEKLHELQGLELESLKKGLKENVHEDS
ncbi:putative BAH domain-containing protein [Helianthus debilis subsp. tardiflorus]